MSRYRFSVNRLGALHKGTIESDSFVAAVDALAEHVDLRTGDLLEIGVNGFPPARYECVALATGRPVWMPAQLAA